MKFSAIILPLLFLITTSYSQTKTTSNMNNNINQIWKSVVNTTWEHNNNGTLELYTFYVDNKNNKECLHQIQGNGFYSVSVDFLDISFLTNFILDGGKLNSEELSLTKHSNEPIVYNRTKRINIEILKKDPTILTDLMNNENSSGFEIHIFKKEDVYQYPTEIYDYDEGWETFLKKVDLNKASLVIRPSEIELYNWESQELTLTKEGLKKFLAFKNGRSRSNAFISHDSFIVTFNNKRIYAGEFLSFMSAMAINHPVIHFDYSTEKNYRNLRIYPVHTINDYQLIDEKTKEITSKSYIKEYFENENKLKKITFQEITFIGKYITKRESQTLVDGTRRWRMTKGFEITTIIKGVINVNYIEIDVVESMFTRGQKYEVSVKVSDTRYSDLGLGKSETKMSASNPVRHNEVVRIRYKSTDQ